MEGKPHKKLRKLPHVFSRVLELPLRSDADVAVEERSDILRFIATLGGGATGGSFRAHAVEIHPGVVKIVVRNHRKVNSAREGEVELYLDKLDIDSWRFRLPSSARPELATAEFAGGELIVTVPKSSGFHREFVNRGDVSWGGGGGGGGGRLVVV